MPGTQVTTVERCSGHDGTWGVKTECFDELDEDRPARVHGQMAEARPTTSALTAQSPAATSSRVSGEPKARQSSIPLTLIRIALRACKNLVTRDWYSDHAR